jgi:indolepyruvate ferredoxin oxidoreductase alpha subunit
MRLLSGNEAIALGAWEGGVKTAFGYPGTPSTEILENLVKYREPRVYCEWSPNEKVAMEAAVGASLGGARAVVTMKCVGLNVAADPLMTLAYIGTEGGLVLVVADDPGQHSSQTEQDTRLYAKLAHIPVLEPSDSQECRDFMQAGLELSEKWRLPVILRTTTRVAHSRSQVEERGRQESPMPIGFLQDPSRHCPLPVWGRKMRVALQEKVAALQEEAAASPLNRIEWRGRGLGIVTSSIAYQYVREVFPEASVLKLGFAFPYPDRLLREFADGVEKVLVVEELDDFLEEHIKSLGIACVGHDLVPVCGELSTEALRRVRQQLDGTPAPAAPERFPVATLPGRPPVFCPGCPHRGLFYALAQFDVLVTGDIGCYSLAVFPPLSRTDVILCMGGGISMAHGLQKAGVQKKVVGVVGDSTFFHSGVTGLMDIVYNRGTSVIVVVDNRTTAMTGHQDHPGTGQTLMGEPTYAASIADFGRACGLKRIRTVNPYRLKECIEAVREELAAEEPSLIISRAPCPLKERRPVGPALAIDPAKCRKCRSCLKLGCPAIESDAQGIRINHLMCAGCNACAEICRFGAIAAKEEAK